MTGIDISNPNWGEENNDLTPGAPFWLGVQARPVNAPDDHNNYGVDTFLIARSDVPMSRMKTTPGNMNYDELAARTNLSDILRKPEVDSTERDPELDKVVEYGSLKPGKDQSCLSFQLQQLAELFGFNVMHEFYPASYNGMRTDSGGRSLGHVLDELALESQVYWTKTDKIIRFRHTNWAERRSWEIPMAWVTAWESTIEKNQQLDFDTFVDIVSKMTDKQIEHNFTYGNPPSGSIDDPLVAQLFVEAGAGRARQFRDFIEMYDRLSASQKTKIWSKDGLSFDEIADDPLFHGESPTMGNAPAYDCSIRLYQGATAAQTISVGDKTVNMGTDDHHVGVGDRPGFKSSEQTTNIAMTMAFWLRDVSAQERDRFTKSLTPVMLAAADNEPIKMSHSAPLWGPTSDRLKPLIDTIKKAREEKAKQTQGMTSP